jgi:hypothetical protein
MGNPNFARRKNERGVTMLLVAVALVALLAMAALAIDVVTLYVSRGEAQRAADAAALSGANMFVSSGFTSGLLGAPSSGAAQAQVCQTSGPGGAAAANRQAEATAALNQVAGLPAAVQSITCNFAQPGNPQLTVTVQRTGLPTFFARIWGGSANTVRATALAEAYNPSGLSAPIDVKGVKPWLVPNCDPYSTTAPTNPNCAAHSFFVNPADGSIVNNGSFIGKTIYLRRISGATTPGIVPPSPPSPPPPPLVPQNRFYVLNVPKDPPPAVCPSTGAPSCSQVGTNDYRDNIACSSRFQFSCGQTVGSGQTVTATNAAGLSTLTRDGARCLIHASIDGSGQGQDVFTTPNGPGAPPIVITADDNNPNPTLAAAHTANISGSDSIVTVPLYDGSNLCPAGCNRTATIVGFLQLGITRTIPAGANQPQIEAVIMNVAGCNPGASGNPVSGGGISAVPVRLIHN